MQPWHNCICFQHTWALTIRTGTQYSSISETLLLKNFILISFQQRLLARAQFDNIAETPDELAFKKGDIITVIEQETGGLEGWWLCSLRGKQGIAPGNRLKLMSGTMVHHERSHTADYPSPTHESLEWHRRSWDGSTNKVKIKKKIRIPQKIAVIILKFG